MSPRDVSEPLDRTRKPDGIAILDFGGQYCHLIARRIREMNVYSEILPYDAQPEEVLGLGSITTVKGIILSGSPSSVRRDDAYNINAGVLDMGLPILGLCYGHQLIAKLHGGDVHRGDSREYGLTWAYIDKPVGVLKGMDPVERVWMSHGDTVFYIPEQFEVLAHTDAAPVAAFRHKTRSLHGLQCHPEVTHTEKGGQMLRNFVFDICDCKANWKPEDLAEKAVCEIRDAVGGSRAIIALSGGVDSSVAAALAARAIGKRLVAVHVDHGLMRLNESEGVEKVFSEMGMDLVLVRAEDRFLMRLKGIVDPEAKRRIIGEEFIRVFEDEARRADVEYLIQGTIYPDRIESGFRRHSDKIKTHHNVGGLPLNMEFKTVLEPLRDLYKDEVRVLGAKLGLPESIVKRQPFPGPGMAVRIVGEVTREKLDLIKRADNIVCEEVEAFGLNPELWQYFAVLIDAKSVGVKGDERAYGWTVAIRMVESVDGMTANFRKPDWSLLERISSRITNEISEVTRVVYDITNKPPSTIEWE